MPNSLLRTSQCCCLRTQKVEIRQALCESRQAVIVQFGIAALKPTIDGSASCCSACDNIHDMCLDFTHTDTHTHTHNSASVLCFPLHTFHTHTHTKPSGHFTHPHRHPPNPASVLPLPSKRSPLSSLWPFPPTDNTANVFPFAPHVIHKRSPLFFPDRKSSTRSPLSPAGNVVRK